MKMFTGGDMCFGIYFERGCQCFCHSGPVKCAGTCCGRPGEVHKVYRCREDDLLGGEILSKMAGGEERPHKFRQRRNPPGNIKRC